MKRIIPCHLFACLSLLVFLIGCEREEIVSKRIALNALEVQLSVTRASDDANDPTLTAPDNRRNWVLDVQIEGSNAEDYIFSEQDRLWIPKSDPVYFPAGINNNGCNVTFTLRPPTSPNTTIGQDSSATRLLELDTLKNTLKVKPQEHIYSVSLAHTNSLIELVFDHSLENRVVEIELQGNNIHHYSIDNRKYLCIVPNGSNNITLTTKVEETERQYTLNIDSGTKPNTRYVFTFLTPTPYSDIVIHSPIISPWSDTPGENAVLEEAFISGTKELIHIEGYTGVISLMASDTLVRLYPHPNSKEGEEGIYYFPLAILKNRKIDSLLLEEHLKNILIGRNTNDINPINLKVNSNGKLLFRKAKDGNILINTVDEILLVNTDLESNYRQEADINLSCISKRSWEPIGNFESPFKGIYDGNGYAIHSLNMDIKQFTAWNPDHLEENPVIQNDFFLRENYWMLPAGAVGLFGINKGTITNVHIASGTISVSEIKIENTKSIALGAICGYNDGGYITYCTNNAELKVHTISSAKARVEDDVFTVGGICGTSRGSIEYSINYGDIIAEKGFFMKLLIGGICGNLYSRYETDKIKINSCINHGNMLFNDLSSRLYKRFGYFGGISGMMYYCNSTRGGFSETIQHISNCYNTGNILDQGTTETTCGDFSGIVARMFFPFSTYSCKISSCYNTGETNMKFIYAKITLDPIICSIFELREPPLPFKLPVENCFYDATTWKEVRHHDNECYFIDYTETNDYEELHEYEKSINEKILNSTPGFSLDSWPTSDLWDTNVWKDLGSWNGGNPIYPKLFFEK
ncbi:hypothetical protein EZS27_021605 [termite gut metagenome]|uniref:GLUG domain-containing protein n=1 Tax=termite gut metagenome TaxID=433724 RepID=A0A5J4R7F1_9ZZZZ